MEEIVINFPTEQLDLIVELIATTNDLLMNVLWGIGFIAGLYVGKTLVGGIFNGLD